MGEIGRKFHKDLVLGVTSISPNPKFHITFWGSPQEVPGVRFYGSRIELKLESIALGLNSNETQIGRHGTRIALELEGHTLGLNLNVTKVSSSLGSLCRSSSIFWCKRVNGPTKQPKKF